LVTVPCAPLLTLLPLTELHKEQATKIKITLSTVTIHSPHFVKLSGLLLKNLYTWKLTADTVSAFQNAKAEGIQNNFVSCFVLL